MRVSSLYLIKTLAVALLLSGLASGQQTIQVALTPQQQANRELENVIVEAESLTDKLARVAIKANAARILWAQDETRARQMFLDLWAWLDNQADKDFDKRVARTEVVKNLLARDRNLGMKLLAEQQSKTEDDNPANNNLRELNDIAGSLIDSAPEVAATVIEKNILPRDLGAAVPLVNRLRTSDSMLADALVSRAIEAALNHPNRQALVEAYSLIDYLFPSTQSPSRSPNDDLRRQFFHAAFEILARNMNDAERNAANDVPAAANANQFDRFFQAQLAGVLSIMATRYAPKDVATLKNLTLKLLTTVPPPLVDIARASLARISSTPLDTTNQTTETAAALTDGDLGEAKRQLDNVQKPEAKKFLEFEIAINDFKAQLSRSNFTDALQIARRIEYPNTKLELFGSVAQAANATRQTQFAFATLEEARTIVSNSPCTPEIANTAFRFSGIASQIADASPDAWLNSAIQCINSLNNIKKDEKDKTSLAFINNPNLIQAFAALGAIKYEQTLTAINTLTDLSVRLAARLAISEKQIGSKQSGSSTSQIMPNGKHTRTNNTP